MFKKFFLLFLLYICAMMPGYAQWEKELPAALRTVSLTERQLTELLATRLQKSYIQAFELMYHNPVEEMVLADGPYTALSNRIKNPEELYPELSNILTTPEQWEMYIISAQNRRVASQMRRTKKLLEDYEAQFPQMRLHEQTVEVPPSQYMKTLADQIPANTKYLLLGEAHYAYLRPHIAQFITHLANSGRKIILFTEFMPHAAQTQNTTRRNELLREYWPVWMAAKQANIPIAGLEPEFVVQNDNVALIDHITAIDLPLWGTTEGVRLRNQHWLRLIKRYREEFPDALFLIYAGGGHLSSERAYSLGKTLAGPDTYTALIVPTESLKKPDELLNISMYDTFCVKQALPISPFIKFDYPLSTQVGFNARVLIPPLGRGE